MKDYNLASLSVSFQTSGLSAGQEPATVHEAAQKPAPTLASLWDRTSAIKKDVSGNFISLRLIAKKRPITLLDGDGWLGSVLPDGKNQWEVVVWREQLSNSRLFPVEADRKAAAQMLAATEDLHPETWLPSVQLPPGKAEEFKPDSFY